MSGVFGVVDTRLRWPLAPLLTTMGARMRHQPWYQCETWANPDAGVGLGRLGIGLLNPEPQPVWNADRSVALVMAGEFYEDRTIVAAPEQLALQRYEADGPAFARNLEGAFVIALWDARRRRLLLTNDRFGLYPTYLAHGDGWLSFAPEVKGVLCAPDQTRSLDLVALAEYVRFQHLLGTRTFFDGVTQLEPAVVLEYELDAGRLTRSNYWSFSDLPHRPTIRFDDAVVETGRLLRRAVERLSSDRLRPGVYLSGGLDSRILLGLTTRRPIASVTYGARNSRDVHYAARVARTMGSQHHWFDLSTAEWVLDYVDRHMALTEGFHSWIHAHGISTMDAARAWVDVNLSGWEGAVMGFGSIIKPRLTRAVNDLALTTHLFEHFNQMYSWPGINEAEEQLLYTPRLRRQLQGVAFDSFREALQPCLGLRPDIRAELFILRHHCGRLTQNMIAFYRSHMEVRFPFFDYQLLDFLYSLPSELRGDRVLYRAVLQREAPSLAMIPYNSDELLPTSRRWVRGAHSLATKVRHRMQRHWPSVFPARHTLYADYEAYMRNDLRPWAEGILFDQRVAERGLFDTAGLRALMARHVSGQEQWTIGKIAPVMTYEMMLRSLHDA